MFVANAGLLLNNYYFLQSFPISCRTRALWRRSSAGRFHEVGEQDFTLWDISILETCWKYTLGSTHIGSTLRGTHNIYDTYF